MTDECDEVPGDTMRSCRNGMCLGYWCLCGRFTGKSEGPSGCGCEYDAYEIPEEDYCYPEGIEE